jgi:glyoxylase-like metal-dependent hydrolase (beta-lactamase superfamily II)
MSGHTPGHSGLVIESNGSSLFILGDVVHSAPLQFTHPEWGIAFDVDQEEAIKARMRSLDMAATDRVMIAGMHIPFPGIGHVEKRGKGYQFIPAPWQYVIE